MRKRFLRPLLAAALLFAVILLAGCLKFENSFDLMASPNQTATPGVPVTNSGQESYNGASHELPSGALQPSGSQDSVPGASVTGESGNQEQTSAPPDSSVAPSSEQPSSAQSVTSPSARHDNTTSPGTTSQQPATSEPAADNAPKNTEYDILRTPEFTFSGSVTTGNEVLDVTISSGKDKIYFTTDIDGLTLGVYAEGKKTYIYAPEQKKYLKMNNTLAKMLKMDPSTFIEMTQGFGFDELPPLSSALSVEKGNYAGRECEIYSFKDVNDSAALKVYTASDKLLRLEYLDTEGNVTTRIDFKSVSAGFPKMPPDGFEEIGYLEFFKLIAGEI